MSDARVVICMPADRPLAPEVADSFAGLYGRGLIDGHVTAKIVLSDTYIDAARNFLVTFAMDVPGATYLCWVDSDMIVPSDAIGRLLARRVPIVGALYCKRMAPFEPVAYHFDSESDGWKARMITLADDPSGLVQVDGLGFGCTLVDLSIYPAMVEHFGDPWWHLVSSGRGEDLHFFSRVKEMGIPVWLDCDVRAGHVTRQTITSTHYESYRKVHGE